ncbi:MAG TPA: hypothetical protein PKL77_00810 [Candidatus Omnitrophota bacterium]|nr:hypothetical protein [Candidatus Omnitrophota bacterium]HPT06536.1 hypothetical protein [Candidatus Omnitrophota bacterium]
MIPIDFSVAITGCMLLLIGYFIIAWFFVSRRKDREISLDPRYIWFCSVCTYTYINTKEDTITTCPRCGSYNKK